MLLLVLVLLAILICFLRGRSVGEEAGFAVTVGDLSRGGNFVSGPHPGVLFCLFEVLLVEELVEGFVVFAGVFCLEGTEAHVGVDRGFFWPGGCGCRCR